MRNRVLGVIAILAMFGCSLRERVDVSKEHSAEKLVEQGVVYLRERDLDRAEASFKVAYELAALPSAIDGLGCVAFLKGSYLLAERHFFQAYEMDNKYLTALGNLALLYETRGLYSKAETVYQMVLDGQPANFRTRNNYAGLIYDRKYQGEALALSELLKAEAMAKHPLIRDNILRIKGYGSD